MYALFYSHGYIGKRHNHLVLTNLVQEYVFNVLSVLGLPRIFSMTLLL